MSDTRIITVCLPTTTDPAELAETALAAVAGLPGAAMATLVEHFPIVRRQLCRNRHLVRPHAGRAAGGRIDRLNLTAMRTGGRDRYWRRWQIWHQVVAGTPVAKPYWTYVAHHLRDPHTYDLTQAQLDYRAQPRIQAMAIYNALPNRVMELPTGHLEWLQAGAHAYAHIGWLSAVVGQVTVATDGSRLQAASGRLTDVIFYLHQANGHITALSAGGHLVAVACP